MGRWRTGAGGDPSLPRAAPAGRGGPGAGCRDGGGGPRRALGSAGPAPRLRGPRGRATPAAAGEEEGAGGEGGCEAEQQRNDRLEPARHRASDPRFSITPCFSIATFL